MSSAPLLPPAGPAVQRCVQRLRDEAQRLSALLDASALASMTDESAARVAVELAAVAESARAGAWAALARVADSGHPQSQGFVTAEVWWQRTTRVSKGDARMQLRLARRLSRHYVATWTAWSTGGSPGSMPG